MQANKFDSGKPPLDLLDRYALEQIGYALQYGAEKYSRHNWRDGIAQSRLIAAALRHLLAHNDGENTDSESQCLHLAHAACCIMFAINMLKTRPDLDDRHKGKNHE
jgi:predicted HD phosphohydrolase